MVTEHGSSRAAAFQISTEVVGKIARCAALEVDGVAEVSCGVQNKKLKSLLESASIQPPVVVEMRDSTASITLHPDSHSSAHGFPLWLKEHRRTSSLPCRT